MLTLSDHQFACQFLLIGFHPTRITAASLYKRIKWFFFPSTMPGSLLGNQTVTPLGINYPELRHCFPSFIKLWTMFLPPVINSNHDDALYPLNQHKREIHASVIDDKQWQEYMNRTFNWKQSLLYKINSKVKGISYVFLRQKIPQLLWQSIPVFQTMRLRHVSWYLNLFSHKNKPVISSFCGDGKDLTSLIHMTILPGI